MTGVAAEEPKYSHAAVIQKKKKKKTILQMALVSEHI